MQYPATMEMPDASANFAFLNAPDWDNTARDFQTQPSPAATPRQSNGVDMGWDMAGPSPMSPSNPHQAVNLGISQWMGMGMGTGLVEMGPGTGMSMMGMDMGMVMGMGFGQRRQMAPQPLTTLPSDHHQSRQEQHSANLYPHQYDPNPFAANRSTLSPPLEPSGRVIEDDLSLDHILHDAESPKLKQEASSPKGLQPFLQQIPNGNYTRGDPDTSHNLTLSPPLNPFTIHQSYPPQPATDPSTESASLTSHVTPPTDDDNDIEGEIPSSDVFFSRLPPPPQSLSLPGLPDELVIPPSPDNIKQDDLDDALPPFHAPVVTQESPTVKEGVVARAVVTAPPKKGEERGHRKDSSIRSPRWDELKSRMEYLYLVEGKTLAQVMPIMKDEQDFDASIKTYKTKFKDWGFRKNLDKDTAKRLIQHKFKRDVAGKISEFRRQGNRTVNLRNYLRRKKMTEYECWKPDETLDFPETFRCVTPPPMSVAEPVPLKLQQRFCILLRDVLNIFKIDLGGLEKGNPPEKLCSSRTYSGVEVVHTLERIHQAHTHGLLATPRLVQHLYDVVHQWQIDPSQGPMLLLRLLINSGKSESLSETELWLVFKSLASWTSDRIPFNHPLRQCFSLVYDMQQTQGTAVVTKFLRDSTELIINAVETVFGRNHPYTLSCIMSCQISSSFSEDRRREICEELERLQLESTAKFEIGSERDLSVRNRVARYKHKLTGKFDCLDEMKSFLDEQRRNVVPADGRIMDKTQIGLVDASYYIGLRYLRRSRGDGSVDMRREMGASMVDQARQDYLSQGEWLAAMDCSKTLALHYSGEDDPARLEAAKEMFKADVKRYENLVGKEGVAAAAVASVVGDDAEGEIDFEFGGRVVEDVTEEM